MEETYTDGMSVISSKQWDFVTQESLSAREAAAFLLCGMQVRTFRDVLKKVCGQDGLEQTLIHGLLEVSGGAGKPDSIRKKVSNWMSGRSIPADRSEIFQICFALKLNLEQSETMLRMLDEQGIHYRSPEEVVFAYGLQTGMTYAQCRQLAGELNTGKAAEKNDASPATQVIRQDFLQIRGEEDFFSFLLRHRADLGNSHNTAYRYFCEMLSLLTGEALEGEEQYSMEAVADTYLRMNVPLDKKTAQYSDIQKMVKKYWPSARSIKAMKSRSEEVNRKTLLLLYLVTGGLSDMEYDELDENYIQHREFLETHCRRMNQMLDECGMCRIDPRNVFDYLLLYCLRPEDELFMSERMSELASEVFHRDAEN